MTKKTEKKIIKYIYIYLMVLVVLLALVYLLPKVNDRMTRTMLVEHGTLSVSDNVTGYIVRDEVVYTAGSAGKPEYNVKEGTKVRKTARIMKVKGGSQDSDSMKYTKIVNMLDGKEVSTTKYRAGINGVVSYYVDGYEGVLNPDRMLKIENSEVSDIVDDYVNLKRDRIVAGDPVYKVYDNSRWYMLIWTDDNAAKNYSKGNYVTIKFKDADIKAKVIKKKKLDNGTSRIVLESDRYYENLAQSRAETVDIITRECSGVIVDNESIAEENGQKGIYVRNSAGEFVFVPVNILLQNDSQSVLSERIYYDAEGKQVNTVDIYDEILRNP